MKYLISESKLKEMLKKVAGVDLTGKISIITNKDDLPMEFNRMFTPRTLNSYLNNFGPIFLIDGPKKSFLYQNQIRNGRIIIADSNGKIHSESSLMDYLGIPPIGLSIDDLINTYHIE